MEEAQDLDLRELQQSVDSHPHDASLHFNLALYLWENGKELKQIKEKAAEHFVISAKIDPQNAAAFRYLGDYYSQVSVDNQRALKCYQRALCLSPDDSHSGESICDLLDKQGKESLEIGMCRDASEKSPRAFWAFRRLGYLQLHQKKWSLAVQSLQHAIRGYPASADLWEALGLAYQQLGMLTAAIKSYGRAIELEDSRIFALIESGNIFLMLGSYRKGVEQFQEALHISPKNVAAHYGLASGLLSLAKECINLGSFKWGASLLEEASKIAKTSTCFARNIYSIWKLYGDIQLTYAKCFPWMDEDHGLQKDEIAFSTSILSWKRTCFSAALCASHSYQRALHLAPWQANIYTDIAVALDVICSLKESENQDLLSVWQLPEKITLGGLCLECCNSEFWVALGCLSVDVALKQHAFVRALQLDVSLAVAWAYLGKLYNKEGEKRLAQQAFDRARSINPSLALPWAGMSSDSYTRDIKPDEAYECCLRAVQILPLADYQIGLAKLALLSGNLSSSQVFGAIHQALQRAPHYPESHNLSGLVAEARLEYQSASVFYRLARCAICTLGNTSKSNLRDISVNLARSLCKAGNAVDAVRECEELKKEGQLDSKGLQIYALSLWQLGKNELALSVVRTLASSILSLDRTSVAASISFICRLLYYISGQDSAITSILKMPKDLFQSSKVSFVVSAIHALDQFNQLESVVSSSRSLTSTEEITGMHFLIALGKLVKHGSEDSLGIQNGVHHLRKTLHMFPNNGLIRNLLSYLLLSSKEWNASHVATRCLVLCPSDGQKVDGLKSPGEILGAGVVACYSTGNCYNRFSFPSCKDHWQSTQGVTQQLQRWFHQEPWNTNARYLLVLNYLQKAREERFPWNLCIMLERLTRVTLSDQLYSKNDRYEKFQLLLCASEICLQVGNSAGCVTHAKNASRILLPNGYLFFAHLLLCRAYAAIENFVGLREEFKKCLDLKTDYHIGWICLKYIESRYKLQTDGPSLWLGFEECSKDIKYTWHMWMAVFNLVHGLTAIWSQDYILAEELLAQACSFASDESCLFLCHGAVCMELAKRQCDSQFLSLAIRSLKRAQGTLLNPLPIVSLLLAQAEGSFGSRAKWEKNLQHEWFSWPPEMRPAELFLQMHLLSRQLEISDSSPGVELSQSSLRWILRAIHLNPSCLRYWKVLKTFLELNEY